MFVAFYGEVSAMLISILLSLSSSPPIFFSSQQHALFPIVIITLMAISEKDFKEEIKAVQFEGFL